MRRNGPTTRPLTVWYGIEPTGASNGVDYELIASIATFPAGEATLTVIILPFDDSDIEGREDVVLSLVQDAGYLVGAANTGLVRNGDNPFLFVTVTATDDAFEAGPVPGAFNVNPSGPLTHASKSSTRSRAPP